MPTPIAHGGAQLVPINLTSPAFSGLNTEQEASILGVEWATTLRNAVFDNAGRPAARKGWKSQTSTPAVGAIKRIFEFYKASGSSEIISTTDADIFTGVSAPASIEGLLAITDGNIKFVNFNDLCIGFGIGTGGIPAVYTGTGSFADIVVNSGTAPTGRIGTAAFGRLWGVDTDGKTIRYSALLDHTRYAVADGGGIIDMSSVWPAGQDSVVAITEFGGDLVVFGKNTTVIWTDGQGSSLGIDPTALYVSDTIPGVGAVSQFAMCRSAEDFWVLTHSGVVGLQRELVQRSTATTNISKNVQSFLLAQLASQGNNIDDISMEYAPNEDFVLLSFPTSTVVLHFDTQAPMQDGAVRATSWRVRDGLMALAYIREGKILHGALSGVAGEICQYTGNNDDGESYNFVYESGWLDLGQEVSQYLKIVKRLTSFVVVEANTNVVHTIEFDFGKQSFSVNKSATGGPISKFDISEFGENGSRDPSDPTLTPGVDVSEFSGSFALRTLKVAGKGSGQFIKIGILVNTNSASFALQQINLFAKIGRMAA